MSSKGLKTRERETGGCVLGQLRICQWSQLFERLERSVFSHLTSRVGCLGGREAAVQTYYAAPERTDEEFLLDEIEVVSRSAVVKGLLASVAGLMAVLDSHRQIVGLNAEMLLSMGIDDPEEVLGLRMGELAGCVHAHEEPNGCGTTRYCSSCGLAIALTSAQALREPSERLCALAVVRDGVEEQLCFRVLAKLIPVDGHDLILVFMRDITAQEGARALERAFFHDVMNLVAGIGASVELMRLDGISDQEIDDLDDLVRRLTHEIDIQRAISKSNGASYQLAVEDVSVARIFRQLEGLYASHPSARGKVLTVHRPGSGLRVRTDPNLVLRIVSNMLTNAFEASAEGDVVELTVRTNGSGMVIGVWNGGVIPDRIRLRVFQKHFSTKAGSGRGLGTFSMRLFAEQLMGRVTFTSSKVEGTRFELALPLDGSGRQ